jgi:alpha-amylase/alpha-mannosidase (GH57 family)
VIAAVNDSSFNTVPARKYRLLWWLALPVLLAFAFAVFKNHQLFATDLVQSIIDSPAPATTIIEKPAVIEQSAKMEKQPMVETSAITELNNRQVVKTEIASEDPDPDTQITVASVAVAEVAMGQEAVTNITSDVIENEEVAVEQQEPETESVENEQEIVTTNTEVNSNYDYRQWIDAKLQQSREWLIKADGDKISIQVLVRSKSAAKELAYFLQNDWPLDLDKTYLYEGSFKTQRIYRVFYNEFDSVSQGKRELKRLPESVQINSPYLHSVYRMRKALL